MSSQFGCCAGNPQFGFEEPDPYVDRLIDDVWTAEKNIEKLKNDIAMLTMIMNDQKKKLNAFIKHYTEKKETPFISHEDKYLVSVGWLM